MLPNVYNSPSETYSHLSIEEIKKCFYSLLNLFHIKESSTINQAYCTHLNYILDTYLREFSEEEAKQILKECLYTQNFSTFDLLLSLPNLFDEEMKPLINIHYDNDRIFKLAHFLHNNKHNQTLHHLIFNCHIHMTYDIELYIRECPNIQRMFEKRDFKNKLQSELSKNNSLPVDRLKI